MLKKINRIKQNKDFNKIFREGKKLNIDFLLFKVSKNVSKDSRFGFVISKKVSKSSAVRNKIKRILSEIIRKKITEIKEGMDIVIIVKADFTKQKDLKIAEVIERALKNTGSLKK
jgi:ribonuclease P protein component